MAVNENVSKVVLGSEVLIDLTEDTVSADKILSGFTAHDKSGAEITGSCTFDADTSGATAAAGDLLSGKTAYVNSSKITGSMANRGAVSGTISTVSGEYTIAQGYHSGSGKVAISSTEKAKIIASNIKQGVQILGVTGSLKPSSSVAAQSKSVTPKLTAQTVVPDESYDYLSQVTVAKIPVAETDNTAGGKTVTIGG